MLRKQSVRALLTRNLSEWGAEMSAKYIPIVKAVARDCGEAARTFGAILYLWIDGKPFYFSYSKIAETAGLSIATVKRHLQTLEENRWIVSAGRKRGRRTNTLELTYPRESILKQGFYRFPLAVNSITGWSKCAVLSIICWRCDSRETGTLHDDTRGSGIEWLVSHGADCGLRRHQVEHAFAALRGIRKGNHSAADLRQILLYDSATQKVTIPPSLITGKSDDTIPAVQYPTIPAPILNTDAVLDSQADMTPWQTAQADMSYVEADVSPLQADMSHIPGGYEPRIYTKHFNAKQISIKPKPSGAGSFPFIFSREEKDEFCSKFFREVHDFRNLHFYSSDEKKKEAAEIAVAAVAACWSDNVSGRNLFPDTPYLVGGEQQPNPHRFRKLLTMCFLPSVSEGRNPPAMMMHKIKELHKQFGPDFAKSILPNSPSRKFAKQILPELLHYLLRMEGTAEAAKSEKVNPAANVDPRNVSEFDMSQYLQYVAARKEQQKSDRHTGLRVGSIDPSLAATAAKYGHY